MLGDDGEPCTDVWLEDWCVRAAAAAAARLPAEPGAPADLFILLVVTTQTHAHTQINDVDEKDEISRK